MCSALLLVFGLSACRDPEPGKTAETGGDSGAGDTDTGDPPPPPIYNESSESGWVDVRTGWNASCALSEAGSIKCWGNIVGEPLPSEPDSGTYVAVRVSPSYNTGYDIFGGITSEGTLYGTFSGSVGTTAAIADFDAFIIGLLDEDRYYCVLYLDGRLDCEYPYSSADVSDQVFQSISVGLWPCGILADGTLECLDPSPGASVERWEEPPAGTFSQLSCSKLYGFVYGFMYEWDSYFGGCCAVSTTGKLTCFDEYDAYPLDLPRGTFTQVSAGSMYGCAVRDTGELACWGDPGLRPDPPDRTFVNVDTQGGHTCGITTEGTILCWGDDHFGQATPP